MRIFIVQDDGTKNFASLFKMGGEIITITDRDYPVGGSRKHMDDMEDKMRFYNPETDKLVLVGDPINIGIAVHIMLRKGGGTVLKWDRQCKIYMPITL